MRLLIEQLGHFSPMPSHTRDAEFLVAKAYSSGSLAEVSFQQADTSD